MSSALAPARESTITRFFRGRRALVALLALGVLLFLPAVRAPFFLDDFLHVAMVEGTFPGARSPLELYDFVGDDNRAAMLERGLLPWWSHPELRIRFFRPLASALVWADHRLFGQSPLPMHLHSLAWWALAVLVVHRFYRQAFERRTALFATAIFALAPCHSLPLAWLANRETLIAVTFGAAALVALRRPLVSAACFALALFGGGEYALAFGGYVIAHALVRRDVAVARRARDTLSFFLPAAAYLAVRAKLGYVASGSGFYTDPLRDPVAFLGKVPWRGAALLAKGWLTYDVGGIVAPTERWLVGALVVAVAALLARPVSRAIGALTGERRTRATWLLLGSLLSLAPVLAVVPAMRLLGVSTIGVALVVAVVVEQAWFRDRTAERTRAVELTWLAALGLAYAHLVHGPASSFLLSRQHRKDALHFVGALDGLRARAPDHTNQRIGVVRGMSMTFFAPFALDPRGRPPEKWCVLAHAGHTLVIRRDEKTFELVTAADRGVFPFGDGNLFRSERAPMRPGAEARTGCLRAKVMEVGARGPRTVRITVDDPASMVWVEDDFDGWKPAELPAVGFGAPFDP